jgi:hypothetical protein
MRRNRFHSFVNFGIIGTRQARAKFAEELFNSLLGSSYMPSTKKTDKDTENFSSACSDISAQKFIKDFVQGNDVGEAGGQKFAEIITLDILDFVTETAEELLTESSPHEPETELLHDVRSMNKKEFTDLWSGLSEYLSGLYENDFDADFFTKKFNATLKKG